MDKGVFIKVICFPGVVLPYIGYISMCGAKVYGFLAKFWSEIGYGLCTLVLNCFFFVRRSYSSSSLGDKTIRNLLYSVEF